MGLPVCDVVGYVDSGHGVVVVVCFVESEDRVVCVVRI